MVRVYSSGSFRSFCLAVAMMPVFTVMLSLHCFAAESQEKMPEWYAAATIDAQQGISIGRNSAAAKLWLGTTNSLAAAGVSAAAAGFPAVVEAPRRGVDWGSILRQSAVFVSIEQGFRIATQPGTQEAFRGGFFKDWFRAVKATKGWGDGDDFLTNYIGHPMQGSVAGYIFVHNDPRGRYQTFNWNSSYWSSRLKAAAWSALYSAQFELGPFSEASIGNVGYHGGSLSGAVDLVITPLAGLGWQAGEDALDKYLIIRIEDWTQNPVILMLARSFLNPTRSFANVIRLKLPWTRDTRPGIWRHDIESRH